MVMGRYGRKCSNLTMSFICAVSVRAVDYEASILVQLCIFRAPLYLQSLLVLYIF